jgi:bacteriocin biosynthesis cyclodehydratase domain-containing protein
MVIKLDSRFPLVWRSPSDMQFGVDPPRLVVHDVTSVQEQLIAALVPGISRSGLSMVASASGASEEDIAALLEELRPVLAASPGSGPSPKSTIAMVGRGPTVERIARTLTQEGLQVLVASRATEAPGASAISIASAGSTASTGSTAYAGSTTSAARASSRGGSRSRKGDDHNDTALGIAVGHYVLDPDVYGYWLRRDIPHLPVIFTDSSVTIGPLIEPGIGPCLYCLERYRSENDPMWPTLATQLWGRHSVTETPLLSREVAARVARTVVNRLRDGRPGAAMLVRLDAERGTATYREELPHPQCGCREVPNAARPGIDLPDAPAHDGLPRRTRIARAAGGRG